MRFLTVVGHINIDIIFKVDRIPEFGSEEVKGLRRDLGGTGANIALIASNLGTPVTLISRVSSSFPQSLLEKLDNEHLELILERAGEEGPTCYVADGGDKQIAFMLQGPMNISGKSYDIDSKFCHFATSNPDWILTLMDRCKGVKIFDPGQEIKYRWSKDKLVDAVAKADLLFLNNEEFNFISSLTKIDLDKAIITLGKEGVLYKKEIISTVPLKAKSTLGAGDAFRGAFYSALYKENDMRKALEYANRVAGLYIKEGKTSLDLSNWNKLRLD